MNATVIIVQGDSSRDDVARCSTSAMSVLSSAGVEEWRVVVVSDERFSVYMTERFGTSDEETKRLSWSLAENGGFAFMTDCRRFPRNFFRDLTVQIGDREAVVLSGYRIDPVDDRTYRRVSFNREPGSYRMRREEPGQSRIDVATKPIVATSATLMAGIVAKAGNWSLSDPEALTRAIWSLGLSMRVVDTPAMWPAMYIGGSPSKTMQVGGSAVDDMVLGKANPTIDEQVQEAEPAGDPAEENESKEFQLPEGTECFFHIVIPCHNSSSLLKRAINSIAMQEGLSVDDVRVTVVDDSSDAPELEAVKAECSRWPNVKLLGTEGRRMAGGARNTALDDPERPVSVYTLFLDSDDEYVNGTVLRRLKDLLVKEGLPDCMCCGYVWGAKTKLFDVDSPEKLAESPCVAPWTRCVRSGLVARFVPDRRMFNDVVQFIRTVDMVGTVSSTGFPVVRYNKDNELSGWHSRSTRLSREAMDAQFLVCMDILAERFEHDYAMKCAARRLKYEIRRNATDLADMVVGNFKEIFGK